MRVVFAVLVCLGLLAATVSAFGPVQGVGPGPAGSPVSGPLTPFGELSVAENTPAVQIDAVYGLNTEEHETFTASGGSATVADRMFEVSTGTSQGGYGVARSRRAIRYRPGQGVVARLTARYTTPVASSQQMAGAFSAENGLWFGYNGTQFGCMRQYGGALEIQTLTLTAGASGTESLTITLNGVGSTFNVSTGTATANAITIAAQSYSGWNAYQVGATVVFVASAVGNKTNTFSFANNTGGGTAAGGFVETQAGAAHSEDWVYQTDWNVDRMDGTGPSGMTLDPTKGNVFQVAYQWLGFGVIEFAIENANTGAIQTVHRIKYPNANTVPSIANPALKIGWVAYSLGSTTNLTVRGASAAGFVTGRSLTLRDAHASQATKTSVGTSLTAVLSIRCAATYGGRVNLGKILPLLASVAVDGTKPADFRIVVGATLGGTPSWSNVSAHSTAQVDTSATTVTGGTTVVSAAVDKVGSERLDLSRLGQSIQLERTDVITLCVAATSGTTDASLSLTWVDD